MPTIEQLREGHGLSRLQLADALGVTLMTVLNWEKRTYEPKASQLKAIARFFEVSMDDIDFEVDPSQEARRAKRRKPPRVEPAPRGQA